LGIFIISWVVLETYLKEKIEDCEPTVYDMETQKINLEQISNNADFVGVTGMYSNHGEALKVLKKIKEFSPETKTFSPNTTKTAKTLKKMI
jgi:hypothetical protein